MREPRRILVTGGSGFIGSHLISHILVKTDWNIVVLDRLDCSSTLARLQPCFQTFPNRITFVWHDLKSPLNEYVRKQIGDIHYIVHLAASSHVDRSIENPELFILDNVLGTTHLLSFARSVPALEMFLNFSTDEVFGPALDGVNHHESAPYLPSNPYAASKAGQGSIGYAFHITYGLPVVTTYTMNNYGERQHPEKLIPKAIRAIERGERMPIHSRLVDGQPVEIGSRYWIHALDTANAVLFLLENGKAGQSYNIVGKDELSNLEVCEKIACIIGKPLHPEFVDFHQARPGHDRRYALDGGKLKELGWEPRIEIDSGLKATVEHTLENGEWL